MKLQLRAAAIVLAVVVAFPSTKVVAQDVSQATLRGRITTDSGRTPLEGVEVTIGGLGRSTRTSADGRYSLASLPNELIVVLVRHPGFGPVRDSVTLQRGVETERNFELGRLTTTLAGVEVTGERLNVALRDFERRRKGSGKFMVKADIERTGAQSFESLVRSHIGGFTLVRIRNRGMAVVGRRAIDLSLTGPRTGMDGTPDRCYSQIFVNGQRVYAYQSPPTAPPTLDEFDVTKIVALEFYRGAAETPTEFSGPSAACGTVAIWTHLPEPSR